MRSEAEAMRYGLRKWTATPTNPQPPRPPMPATASKLSGRPAATKMARPMGRARKEPDKTRYSGRLAIRLRELREQGGLTVDDVIERLQRAGLDVKRATYYAYECGDVTVPLDLFPALTKALKATSPSDLLPPK